MNVDFHPFRIYLYILHGAQFLRDPLGSLHWLIPVPRPVLFHHGGLGFLAHSVCSAGRPGFLAFQGGFAALEGDRNARFTCSLSRHLYGSTLTDFVRGVWETFWGTSHVPIDAPRVRWCHTPLSGLVGVTGQELAHKHVNRGAVCHSLSSAISSCIPRSETLR